MQAQVIELENHLWWQTLKKLRHDFYHLPEYVYLESKRTNTIPEAILISEGEKYFFIPYLLRSCDHLFDGDFSTSLEAYDIVSPYGYPGILLSEAAVDSPEFMRSAITALKKVLSERNVCSAFFRLHPIINLGLENILPDDVCKVKGETVSINLELSEAEIWRQTRNDHRNKINWCKRAGMIAKMVPFQEYIGDFIEIYQETMNRVGAVSSYYFDYDYFCHLSQIGDRLHLCIVEWEEQIACAGFFTECCGIVQFHLSGTRDKFLKQAPSKLMLDYVRYWAKERGNKVFHLGGGVGSTKDSLFEFKSGFSKQSQPFVTIRFITNEEQYNYLVELRAKALNTQFEEVLKSDFFPAYRSPSIR
jgi:Acetyltransferase (GNAT) domain